VKDWCSLPDGAELFATDRENQLKLAISFDDSIDDTCTIAVSVVNYSLFDSALLT
jgi:hypothetical protein